MDATERLCGQGRHKKTWRRPKPGCKGPNRGPRVTDPPLFLDFMHALNPHFQWIAANLRCSLPRDTLEDPIPF